MADSRRTAARFDLGELTHQWLGRSGSLSVPGPVWFLVLDGTAYLETAGGSTPVTVGDAVWVDGRTAFAVGSDGGAKLAVGDLRVVVATRAVPSPLVVRGFAERHAGVADLVKGCPLDGACRASVFADGYGTLIGAAMTESWQQDEGPVAEAGDPLVARVLEAVVADPANKWSVESLASLVHLSRSALSARFQKALGRSPVRVLREVRMGEARRLLSDPRLPVEAVASRCGYGSLAAFSRAFTADHGSSPQSWRTALLENRHTTPSPQGGRSTANPRDGRSAANPQDRRNTPKRQDGRSTAKPMPLSTAQIAPTVSAAATP
ncbi:AraC family transcriptional regulator [Kribbella sp.]|uniref:helix-turn-helix transcriptional regulator n=1 Tax=Kribbella sp. TaxID=1871183 RepID=UPI002D696969|nr:AraC family transcriptional regulator [Kribbella sp.]HZX01422.1 AraC family transcriptional regulator [Kribbella sp.]